MKLENPSWIREQVVNYLKKHPSCFHMNEIKFILGYFDQPILDSSDIPDLIRELYDELGILPDDNNLYLGFLDLIKEEFPVEKRHVLEVGGGILPRLGKRISALQTTGTIVVYDPRLSIYEKDTDKLTLVRKPFRKNENIGDVDLLLGLMPCEATDTLIQSALDHRTDFMVALCEGGVHGDEFDYFEDEEEWIHSIMCEASRGVEEQQMGKLKVKSLKKYGDPYPVIYNDRRK